MKERARTLLARLVGHLLSLSSRPLPLTSQPALIVAPHADDETLGCGALIAAKVARCAPVHVVFVTDSGAAGWSAEPNRAPRAAHRRAEALAALAALGLAAEHTTFLDAPDGELGRLALEVHTQAVERFAALLRALRPTEIFLPLLGEGSTEHDDAVWLTREALALAGARPTLWEYPVWAWWNALRLRRQLLRRDENFRLDATPWLDAKRRALACHASQLPHLPRALKDAAHAPCEFYFRRAAFSS
jgi:LmbE family N-acetylglucosaminyl deacetylase